MGISRITIEVGGYNWRVHGNQGGGRFQIHLVELLGNERLDVPLNQKLRLELRCAVAKFLDLEIDEVKPIPADLILA